MTLAARARWTRTGALAAVALVLGYLESFVPLPIPGAKLGLANIPVLVALAEGDRAGACWVAALKVAASAALFGGPAALAYSAAGTALSLATMVPLSALPTLRLEVLSVGGATAHEVGQLLVAQALLGTGLVWYAAAPLFVVGCVTGWLCGAVAARAGELLAARDGTEVATAGRRAGGGGRAKALALMRQDATRGCGRTAEQEGAAPPTAGWAVMSKGGRAGRAGILQRGRTQTAANGRGVAPACVAMALVAWLALAVWLMRTERLAALAACAAAALGACAAARATPAEVARALRPVAPIALVACVAQVATLWGSEPAVIFGPVALPVAALEEVARTTLRLAGMCAGSAAMMAALGTEGLAKAMAGLLARLGPCAEGPALALATMMRALPMLAARADDGARARLTRAASWRDELPQLVVDACALAVAGAEMDGDNTSDQANDG